MLVEQTGIPGCVAIQPAVFQDARGRFVKVFHEGAFAEHGLVTHFAEDYYSVSRRGVLRGMHFQTPPADHAKLVYCLRGEVLDAVVDLRQGSPTYGQHFMTELTAARANMLYVPRGLAHGFYVTSDDAVMAYKVETVHSASSDTGVAWDSCGIPWPVLTPVLSERDGRFPRLADLDSPFRFLNPAGVAGHP